MSFSLVQKSKSYPVLPYETIKNTILGKQYVLTVIFIGEKRALQLNITHRKATYVPNVLSFPLTTDTGEIYITPILARTECQKFNLSPDGYIAFLYIHALLHLNGHAHSDTMEKAEKQYMKRFKIT